MDTTWVEQMFPGDGLELPSDEERDHADRIITEWSLRWNEDVFTIDRRRGTHPGMPTNRAFLRSRLRRWWRRP